MTPTDKHTDPKRCFLVLVEVTVAADDANGAAALVWRKVRDEARASDDGVCEVVEVLGMNGDQVIDGRRWADAGDYRTGGGG